MVKIILQDIRIESISNSSGVFSGTNIQTKWQNGQIINDAFGSIPGNSNTKEHSTAVHVSRKPERL